MENFINLMTAIFNFMKTPFTVWGHEFSFWGIFITIALLSIAFGFIAKMIKG